MEAISKTERERYLQLSTSLRMAAWPPAQKEVILEANPAAARSLNLNQELLMGKPLSLLPGQGGSEILLRSF
ncbi:MAG: hypothetical protein LUO89_00395 [Methanothrix sp.]|nr:hypothetical protein [Methanothrix sp.]